AEPRTVARVVDAVEGVDGRHAGHASGQTAVHSRSLAVRVHELDVLPPDELEHVEEGPSGETVGGDADEARAALDEDAGVDAPGRPRHRDGELLARQARH